MPHPSDLRVRVFLPCTTLCDAITGGVISILSPSVVIAAVPFSERGEKETVSCEYLTKYVAGTVSGYVVMPEHVHLLLSEPKKGTPSKVLQVLKQKVSRSLRGRGQKSVPGQLSFPFSRMVTGAAAFLAAAILRFQCVEREEGEGEIGIHARESGESETGGSSETGRGAVGHIIRKARKG